jgi:hypothetical protein
MSKDNESHPQAADHLAGLVTGEGGRKAMKCRMKELAASFTDKDDPSSRHTCSTDSGRVRPNQMTDRPPARHRAKMASLI